MRPLRGSTVDVPSSEVKLEEEQVREGERSEGKEDRGSSVQGLWLGGAVMESEGAASPTGMTTHTGRGDRVARGCLVGRKWPSCMLWTLL